MKGYLDKIKSLQIKRKSIKNYKETSSERISGGIMLKNNQNLLPNLLKRGKATQSLKMLWTKPQQTTPFGEEQPQKAVWSQQQMATDSTVDTKGSNKSNFLFCSRSCSQHFLSLRAKFDSQQQSTENIFQQPFLTVQQLNQQQQANQEKSNACDDHYMGQPISSLLNQEISNMFTSQMNPKKTRSSSADNHRTVNSTSDSTVASTVDEDIVMSEPEFKEKRPSETLNKTPAKAGDDVQVMCVSPTQFRITSDGYIWTPGNHKISISEYLMQGDLQMKLDAYTKKCPAISAQASYAQDMYTTWISNEQLVDANIFQLSFRPGTDIEKFRRMAILFVLQHVYEWGLSNSTAHMSVINIHRILLHYTKRTASTNSYVTVSEDHEPKPLTTEVFVGSVLACLRMAIKHEERPDRARPMRSTPNSVCRLLGIDDPHIHIDSGFMNSAEQECLQIIAQPMTITSTPEFLERYLLIGQWPNNLTVIYRDLAHYLVSLSFFSRRDIDQLAGIVPSLLAAAALSLAIRVISAGSDEGYECWPHRLVVYTNYSTTDIKPGVRGLSALLRQKPEGSKLLEKFHPRWANLDWK